MVPNCKYLEMNMFTAFPLYCFHELKLVAFLKHAECLSSPELEQEQNKCIDSIGQEGGLDICR